MLEVFSEYGNRFADKYGSQLGELAGAGAVAMGLMAEFLKCDCGGMRIPKTVENGKEELYYCKQCDSWWRLNAGGGNQKDLFSEGD